MNNNSIFEGLIERVPSLKGRGLDKSVYIFKSLYGVTYFISDEKIVNKIKELLDESEDNEVKIKIIIYEEAIKRYGIGRLLSSVEVKIDYDKRKSYIKGKKDAQREFRNMLGIEE